MFNHTDISAFMDGEVKIFFVFWECVQFWDTLFHPFRSFEQSSFFFSSAQRSPISSPFISPWKRRHSWDDSPPIRTTSSVGDSAAHTTSCSKSLSQQQAIRRGHYQRCLSLWDECVWRRDQVKFLHKENKRNLFCDKSCGTNRHQICCLAFVKGS